MQEPTWLADKQSRDLNNQFWLNVVITCACGPDFLKLFSTKIIIHPSPFSVEQDATSGSLSGHIRIRAKSQGMALSLGDKITMSQKKEQGA